MPSVTAADDSATIISRDEAFAPSGTENAPTASGEAHDAGLLSAGTRVAEFQITRVVGQGGFGVVYEAWDHTLERVVAIKEYLPTALSTRQGDGTVVPLSERHRETFDMGMRSFINEARLLAQFDHASLLKVYRFWQERGTTYMVMPFYRGDTLRQALASHPGGADEAWLLRIMDGVTQALGVMHAANCYHRDIAPDNILLLEGSGRPVVLDFGAARRVIVDKTQAMTVILKPGYAPIEQYAEMPDMTQGAWTDVYALAAVMHVAVSGRSPPPSVARVLTDSYVPLATNETLLQRYSPHLLSAIDAGLGVRPEARPQSMAALRKALCLEEFATQATEQPAVTLVGAQAVAGKGRVVSVLAGLAVVTIAIGCGWWWQGREARAVPVAASSEVKELPSVVASTSTSLAPLVPLATLAPPPAAPLPLRTAEQLLHALGNGVTTGFEVKASPRKSEVVIGRDKLTFELNSNRDGYAYVYLLSSSRELFLLFPNLLDKYNRVTANTVLALPRASWPMNSGGPAGVNEFVVLVSEHEREFSASGVQNDGVFPQFPLPTLAALDAVRGSGPTPLLGKPVCPGGAPCTDAYGLSTFKIVEK